MGGPGLVIFVIFGGYLVPYETIPIYFISFFMWAFKALVTVQFRDFVFDPCHGPQCILGQGTVGGDAVIEVLGWDTDSVLLPCMILLSLWAVASVGAYFCMR